MRKALVIFVLLCSACGNKDADSGASAPPKAADATGKTPPAASPPPPAKTGAQAQPAGGNVSVRATTIAPRSLGVSMSLKPGAMEGSSYKAMAEVVNKAAKEIASVYWKVCTYEADGKLRDGNMTNGGNAAIKPGGKGEVEVYVDPAPLVGFVVTGYKGPDGAAVEAPFGESSCPDSVKP